MKHIIKILFLALCAVLLLPTQALAAEVPSAAGLAPVLAPVRVWGTVAKEEDGSLLLSSGDPDSSNPEIIVRLTEETYCVDGVTGLTLDMEQVEDGDTLVIWLGPAMTMSLPPQATAVVVVGGVPADGAVPQYAEIAAPAVPADVDGERKLTTTDGELTVLEDAEVSPFKTKNTVTLDSLTPGTQFLAWTGAGGKVNRVLVFPYAYAGYLGASEDGGILLGGAQIQAQGRVLPVEDMDILYLPLRAVAEAAGYEVDWVSGKGAVVSSSGTELFSVQPGADTAQTAGDERGLLGGCVVDNGVTYLPAGDLAGLLRLYIYSA